MKSVMIHNFSSLTAPQVRRSKFDRSHGYKTTFNPGVLVPFYVDEALPGDTFTLDATLFTRLTTPVVPIMDNLFLDTFFFAVPNRLIWDHWQNFMGEQKNPGDSVDYVVPTVTCPVGGFAEGGLEDYFGLPVKVPNLRVSALWHRAYNLIYNEYFRDENLCESATVKTDDGPDPDSIYYLRKRGKRHDYFTSCLPWPQKFEAPGIPLAGNIPVFGTGMTLGLTDGQGTFGLGDFSKNPDRFPYSSGTYGQPVGTLSSGDVSKGKSVGVATDPTKSGLVADLTGVTAVTVNALREAFAIQHILEKDARGGTRYTEILYSHFGVRSSDARLQRPEYLGGSSSRINFTPVQQTSGTSSESPQGNLAAFAVGNQSGHAFTKSFEEHCVVIGLMCVRADLTYQDGINRMFSRRTRFDYFWPSLANLGEQAVLNKELYAQGNEEDDKVFGYQERFAEYRYKPSTITGKMRSKLTDTLDFWHLSQKFSSLPALNASFIEEDVPIKRVLAVQNQPAFLLDAYLHLICARPMPVYAVPGLTRL